MLSTARFSKFPPVAPVIFAEIVLASLYTSSSAATVTSTVPVVSPASIVIVSPLDSVTVTSVSAGFVNVAVYVTVPPASVISLVADRLTVVVSTVSDTSYEAVELVSILAYPPPLVELIAIVDVPASEYTSSP